MITVPHLEARASRPGPAAPGASPALTPSRPDAVPLRSDRRPGLPLDQSLRTRRSAVSTRPRVPLRRKRPAGTQGGGDIDEPSVVTERSRSIGNHAASEIDAPGPCLTPTCGGRTRRPRTEEWPLPDDHPRSRCQLGALDPRSPITEGFELTVPDGLQIGCDRQGDGKSQQKGHSPNCLILGVSVFVPLGMREGFETL
jgi:hypothetical protein